MHSFNIQNYTDVPTSTVTEPIKTPSKPMGVTETPIPVTSQIKTEPMTPVENSDEIVQMNIKPEPLSETKDVAGDSEAASSSSPNSKDQAEPTANGRLNG